MTPTRYLADAIETTNHEIEDYLAALADAERTGKSRAIVINRHFDALYIDIEKRFFQTVGLVQALALFAQIEPFKTRLAVLLQRTLADETYMYERTADADVRKSEPGNDHNAVCEDIANRFDGSLRLWAELARDIAHLGGGSIAVRSDHAALAISGPAIVAAIMNDFDMLAEQFRDFQHEGTTEIYHPGEVEALVEAQLDDLENAA
jgi:hypothetical protein